MMRYIPRLLFLVFFLVPFVAYGQRGSVVCQSAATMNAIAANVASVSLAQNPNKECFTGTCYPITMIPGDIIPDDGNVYIDNAGNSWSLASEAGENPVYWGDRIVNGAVVPGGPPDYLASLRMVGGVVYMQFAKFGGWYLGHQLAQTNAPQFFVGNEPGPGDFCQGTAPPPPAPSAGLSAFSHSPPAVIARPRRCPLKR
jgi:hypothetical protein